MIASGLGRRAVVLMTIMVRMLLSDDSKHVYTAEPSQVTVLLPSIYWLRLNNTNLPT